MWVVTTALSVRKRVRFAVSRSYGSGVGLAEAHDARDDDEKPGILLRLDAAARVACVLDGQGMKPEQLGEQRRLLVIGHVEVDPQGAAFGAFERGAQRVQGEIALDLSVGAPVDAVWKGLWHGVRRSVVMRWARSISSERGCRRARPRGRYAI
jgi:hypothetical protein